MIITKSILLFGQQSQMYCVKWNYRFLNTVDFQLLYEYMTIHNSYESPPFNFYLNQ